MITSRKERKKGMIFCNFCGNAFADGLDFCTECGTRVPQVRATDSLPTVEMTGPASTMVAATSQAQFTSEPYAEVQPLATTFAPSYQPAAVQVAPKTKEPATGLIIVVVGAILILFVAVVIFFVARPSTRQSTSKGSTYSTGSPADNVANSLNDAISNNRLVNLSGDDAFAYYTRLKSMDPQHSALSDIKSRVLPQLVNQGDETINRRINHTGIISNEDWRTAVRVYDWAHQLEPSDRTHEAKWKYLIGKWAENERRLDEAWDNIYAASQLNPTWAAPQNDLGLLVQAREDGRQQYSNSVPYFEKAIQLQPDWDIPNNNLGSAYFYLGDYNMAETFYRKAISLNPSWARPHKWLGDIYYSRQAFQLALQEYLTAINLYNPNTDTLALDVARQRVTQLQASGY